MIMTLCQYHTLSDHILAVLDEHSAQDTIEIDIRGKSSVADYMIVSSGRSNRHVGALADYAMRSLKERGLKDIGVEGLEGCDWVLIDAGDGVRKAWRAARDFCQSKNNKSICAVLNPAKLKPRRYWADCLRVQS